MPKPPTLSSPKTEVDVTKLLQLLEQWTRCEIMGRLGAWDNEFISWVHRRIELEDEIRVLVFGSDDLVVLGNKWKLLGKFKKEK